MARFVMTQHLSQKLDNFGRCDASFVKAEQEVASAADSRHGRHPRPFPSDSDFGCVASDAPCLAEKRSEGYVCFVLKVQNGSVFPDRAANPRDLRSGPFLAGLLVKFIVLPLGLLVRQPCLAQSPQYRVARDAD